MTSTATSQPLADRLEKALAHPKTPPELGVRGAELLSHLRKPVQIAVIGAAGSGKTTLIDMLLGSSAAEADGNMREDQGSNFVEVELEADQAHRALVLEKVVEWADLVLWCSQEFDASEQALWARAPDHIKDHSFLVLTKADREMMKGTLTARIKALDEIVAEEFLALYPVAAKQAIAARRDGEGDNPLWQSSGGRSLYDAVRHQVDTGRSADADHAQLLLQHLAGTVGPTQTVKVTNTELPAATAARFRQALDLLQDSAAELMTRLEQDGTDTHGAFIDDCAATVIRLQEVLFDGSGPGAALRPLEDDLIQASEMMTLFRLEKSERAASDAVMLLLQLRKDITTEAQEAH